ncbi:hypothetical protein [Aliikangiella coralliicola]|uniref:Uncharacterized protein n=1 Tax=Aliikangiella coralliicola TaxID=2592383 RepID=A0A545U4U4_9GAMM|nr:hypothetical protein [Aliikangiella coralliicola]TQV84464.1 hypothetical protein FLL46_22875 [Aliikangiella coralliicola]
MKKPDYFSYAIRALLAMAATVLTLNFACANGAGVKILNWFGLVANSDIDSRTSIMEGVNLMQWVIIAVIGTGLAISCYFFVRGVIGARNRKQKGVT